MLPGLLLTDDALLGRCDCVEGAFPEVSTALLVPSRYVFVVQDRCLFKDTSIKTKQHYEHEQVHPACHHCPARIIIMTNLRELQDLRIRHTIFPEIRRPPAGYWACLWSLPDFPHDHCNRLYSHQIQLQHHIFLRHIEADNCVWKCLWRDLGD